MASNVWPCPHRVYSLRCNGHVGAQFEFLREEPLVGEGITNNCQRNAHHTNPETEFLPPMVIALFALAAGWLLH